MCRVKKSRGRGQQQPLPDLGDEDIQRRPLVVQTRGYEDDAAGARYAGKREYPKENPIKNQSYILPVINDL